MITLHEAISKKAGAQAPALLKHIGASGIKSWNDLTKANLSDLRDNLLDALAPGTARTYMAVLAAVIARYDEDVDIPCKDYHNILKCKNDRPVKTYLDQDEIALFEAVPTLNENESFVKAEFCIGLKTGMRLSDIKRVTSENITNGLLTYVSRKTGIRADIPCSVSLAGLIERASGMQIQIPLMTYNRIIRRLCERAGINKPVKVRKGGKEITGPKWRFISSHSARISFCTVLSQCGVPIKDLSRLAGHSNVAMTERYIVNTEVKLNDRAMAYLK